MNRRVVFAYFDGCEVLDFAGPLQAFHEANSLGAGYRIEHCSASPVASTAQGLQLYGLAPFTPVSLGEMVLLPGFALNDWTIPLSIIQWLKQCYQAGAILCSVCTGAFALAEAGLLNGRRCTTHWKRVSELQEACPSADVRQESLFVTDGRIMTSAGIVAGVDMALAIVERDYGPLMASQVAREMVVYMRRDSRHKQESAFLAHRTHLHPGVHVVQDWLTAHPGERASIEHLAKVTSMSPRNLTRAFRESTGITVHAYRSAIRLEHARNLMSNPELTIGQIAAEAGFSDPRQFRRVWLDETGHTPSESRAHLAAGARQGLK